MYIIYVYKAKRKEKRELEGKSENRNTFSNGFQRDYGGDGTKPSDLKRHIFHPTTPTNSPHPRQKNKRD
jgi:hypothetical protein